ncbi:MAG: DnaJ domain-containing protein [Anaerovoracaceae bacterium]
MRDFTDYYKVLQVHPEAGADIITAAYRCFSKLYHPDLNADQDASEIMAQINVAYDVLGNPARRESYHRDWVELNGHLAPAPSPSPDPFEEKRSKDRAGAAMALRRFFDDHLNEKWEASYRELTEKDRENIPLEEYIEWKEAVAALYKLTEYEIRYIDAHPNCEYAGTTYPAILHFAIDLVEQEVATGGINREQTVKYVARDGAHWRVCLGYTELKSSIRKLHYLARAMPKLDRDQIISRALARIDSVTGLYSRTGFIEQVTRELKRSRRYGNPLSIGVIELRSKPEFAEDFEQDRDVILAEVADLISLNTRETDLIGRIGETSFALLFIETAEDRAEVPIHRLAEAAYGRERCEFMLHCARTRPSDEEAESWIDRTHARIELVREPKQQNGEVKLGKYHLSDILEFNRKGRNHF